MFSSIAAIVVSGAVSIVLRLSNPGHSAVVPASNLVFAARRSKTEFVIVFYCPAMARGTGAEPTMKDNPNRNENQDNDNTVFIMRQLLSLTREFKNLEIRAPWHTCRAIPKFQFQLLYIMIQNSIIIIYN